MSRSTSRMLLFGQFLAAYGLVFVSTAMIVFWFALAALALHHALDPWVNAGILGFGIGLVAVAAVIGIPGVLWTRRLARRAPAELARHVLIPAWIGAFTLVIGGIVAVSLLIWT